MTRSFSTTLVMLFSILAMLMSSYVASQPMMAMNGMLVNQAPTMTEMSTHHAADEASYTPMSNSHHAMMQTNRCHGSSPSTTALDVTDSLELCGDPDSGMGHCNSVCSSVSYPIVASYASATLISSLALHQTEKIGDEVNRIQSLLRPPSA